MYKAEIIKYVEIKSIRENNRSLVK